MSVIRTHSNLRLYINPLFWTPYHFDLLKVSVSVFLSETTPSHRPTCPKCNGCGEATQSVLYLVETLRQYWLPLFFGYKQQYRVVQPLLVQDSSSGASLVAFTHESSRSDTFNNTFRRFAVHLRLGLWQQHQSRASTLTILQF